jgi:acetyltransferase-like isoleucine patch superfamily enzyme
MDLCGRIRRAGVTIGEGAIVGARAVAVKDVKPSTIGVGNLAGESKRREITQ